MRKKLMILAVMMLPITAWAGIAFYNSSNARVGEFSEIKCSTNMTCSKTAGQLVMSAASAALSLSSDEAITNSVDDTVEVKSNDEATTLRVEGFEAKSAILELASDDGDDTADVYSWTVDTSDVLTLKNGSTSLMTRTSSGDASMVGTTPYLTIGDNGAEDSGVVLDGLAGDYNISADESLAGLVIGVGTAAGTTDAIRVAAATQNVTIVKNLTGSAASVLSGFSQSNVASTTVAITSAQCGVTFVSNSADVMTLPEASTVLGCRLTFVCGTADDFDVNPADGTDAILSVSTTNGSTAVVTLAPSAGDAIRCTDIGGSITLQAIGNDAWAQVAGGNGIWTDVN